jgi:hypothetical protein
MKKRFRMPSSEQQVILDQVKVRLVEPGEENRFVALLEKHHYLGAPKCVGQRLFYVATVGRKWVALLVWNSAANHLRHREDFIRWTPEQRRRRRTLLANNSRFLILPEVDCPNLASRILSQCLSRLPDDWDRRYGHPILLVETFVDPEQFSGASYRANGWIELGKTAGFGRRRGDYYVQHDKPKLLFVRALTKNACRTLQAEHLPTALAHVDTKLRPKCHFSSKELQSMADFFSEIPEYRTYVGSYPLSALMAISAAAHLCGAQRGYRDLEAFAGRLTQAQRRNLKIRMGADKKYPSPSKATFCRLFQQVDGLKVEEALKHIQTKIRGPVPKEELIVMDGKEGKHSGGAHVVSAVSVPGQHFLGCELVEEKTNEIPAVRDMVERLDLDGRVVALDALHTQTQTARELVQNAGADYLMTVKDNQKGIRRTLKQLLPETPAVFPPSA